MWVTARRETGAFNLFVQEITVSEPWRDRVEHLLGDRKATWVLAGLAALGVTVSLLAWVRGPAPQIAPPATAPSSATITTPPPSPGSAVAPIYVHVAGAVRRPGLYEFPAGTRAADAIDSAGGPRRDADLDAINLASVLVDGMKLEVPQRGEVVVPSTTPAAPGSAPGVGLVDLNLADQTALEAIPGIGPVTATAILQHRAEIGRFESVEQLLDVTGIGPATLEALRPYVTV